MGCFSPVSEFNDLTLLYVTICFYIVLSGFDFLLVTANLNLMWPPYFSNKIWWFVSESYVLPLLDLLSLLCLLVKLLGKELDWLYNELMISRYFFERKNFKLNFVSNIEHNAIHLGGYKLLTASKLFTVRAIGASNCYMG